MTTKSTKYALSHNGRQFGIRLLTFRLTSVASFKEKYSLNFGLRNEATWANLQVNKRILKWRPFWNKACIHAEW